MRKKARKGGKKSKSMVMATGPQRGTRSSVRLKEKEKVAKVLSPYPVFSNCSEYPLFRKVTKSLATIRVHPRPDNSVPSRQVFSHYFRILFEIVFRLVMDSVFLHGLKH